MAIEKTYLLGKNITLGCGFDLQAKAPLDSRQVVPEYAGLQALIDGNAAYEGMIVYDEETKKTYQAQLVDGVLAFREFGINEAELKDLIASETTAAMEFKGATATLPENPAKGDMYKVSAQFKFDGATVKVGDSIVYDGTQWHIIPSGDDIEDTWRPVTDVDNDASLTFAAMNKLDVSVASNGTVTYSHKAINAPENVTAEGDEKTRTYITAVETDGFGHITGYKTATENVEDTNTTYTFEGQSDEATSVYFQVTSNEEGAAAEVIYLDAYSKNEADAELAKKLDKSVYEAYIAGKEMSDAELKKHAEDYADSKVAGVDLSGIATNAAAIEAIKDSTWLDSFKDVEDQINLLCDAAGDVNELKTEAKVVVSSINEVHDEVDGLAASLAEGGATANAIAAAKKAGDDAQADITTYKTSNNEAVAAVKATADAAAVKTEVEAELAKKVDIIAGKDLIATSEIERLANVDNYDDEEVRDLIGDNAQAIETLGEYVGTIPTNYTETDVIAYINKKAEETLAAAQGGSSETAASVKQQLDNYKSENDTRVKTAEDAIDAAEEKIAALEEASAKHALKTEVEAVDAKFADYNTTAAQKVIDDAQDVRIKAIEDDYVVSADIANFETKANVKQIADDLAAYEQSNDAALAEVKATAEAARTEDEVNSQIDTKIAGLNLATTYEPVGAETRAKAYADGLISDANLAQYTTEQEVKDIVDGVIAGAVDGDTITGLANLVEYLNTHGGEAAEMGAAIDVLEGKVEVIEGKPAYGITATQVSNWDNEVGAKALAETKTTTAEVKSQIEAYGYATTGYADGKASDAQAAAEGHANSLNTAMNTRVEALEDDTHTHANKAELDKFVDGDKAKLDTAAQTVTAAADSGLKATRTGNDIAIAIDDSIVFVFDCGDAGVTA